MKIPGRPWPNMAEFETLLFDLEQDPGQERPVNAPDLEQDMIERLTRLMRASDAPSEQYRRLALAEHPPGMGED